MKKIEFLLWGMLLILTQQTSASDTVALDITIQADQITLQASPCYGPVLPDPGRASSPHLQNPGTLPARIPLLQDIPIMQPCPHPLSAMSCVDLEIIYTNRENDLARRQEATALWIEKFIGDTTYYPRSTLMGAPNPTS